MTDFWDDKEIFDAGEFIKFEHAGDTITGTITAIRKHTFDDGKIVPQISINTTAGEDKIVTAGQYRLKQALVELRPRVGDILTITYTREEKLAGGKTLKHFDVKLGPTQQAAPAVADALGVGDPGADPLTGWDTVKATTTAPAAPAAPAVGKPAQAKELLAAGVPAADVAEAVGLPLNIVTALANTL